MKRIVICCILAAAIAAGGIIGLVYTEKTGEYITDSLREVSDCFEKEDTEGAKAAARRASDKWRDFRRFHIFITDNDHALEITMSAERIEKLLEREDDEVMVECGVMAGLVEEYCREHEVRLGNIF